MRWQAHAPPPLPQGIDTTLSLILREAVTNIARHADASTARLQFVVAGDVLQMIISDDGRGIGTRRGNGLTGMRERVEAVDGVPVPDAIQLRQRIRAHVSPQAQHWRVLRGGSALDLNVLPEVQTQGGVSFGRIGAVLGSLPATTIVRLGFLDGLEEGVQRTWEIASMSLQTMGRMALGQASLKNLSGPLSIADYAGRSAQAGWTSYLLFVALISVSLGVLNLLPIPVLDGGHLMYYLWEFLTGKPVSAPWMERFQRVGMAFLGGLMLIALFNDVARMLGS